MSILGDLGYVAFVVIGGTILGGVLAAVADATIAGQIAGTPLGPASSSSPIAWSVVGAVVLVGGKEVSG
ncbi:hypothetical protein [Halorubrum halophilum]|uniref:hypothetical protein n=1 Tax=Halorubrum halophilum TaxID=413816 RepID=UPI0012ABD5E2|nr:hypothetical protein [Halorubrum halophilum]